MKHSNILKIGFSLFASTALSGCLLFGSSSGGGAGGGGTASFASYQGEFDRVSGQAPTSDMPTTLNASYSGAMHADVTDGTEVVGQIIADVDLDVDWTDGQTSNPFSGGASNFRGTEDGGTTVVAIEGELEVDDSLPGTINRNETVVNLPQGGTQTVATGAMLVHLTGELTLDGQTADTMVQLGGTFLGSEATAAVGTAVGGFSSTDPDPLNGLFDGTLGGTYYLEQN